MGKQVGEGTEGSRAKDPELSLGYFKLEMYVRYSSGHIKQAVGCKSL